MEITVKKSSIVDVEAGAVAVSLFEGAEELKGPTEAVDRALDGAIRRAVADGEFKGKLGSTLVLRTLGKTVSLRVVVVGLGKREKFDAEAARVAAGAAAQAARAAGARTLATIAHGASRGGIPAPTAGRAVAEGTLLGLYRYREMKSRAPEDEGALTAVTVVEREAVLIEPLERGITQGRILAEATNFARDLGNRPANHMTPTRLAEAALEMAGRHGLACEVLERGDMERLGMGAMLGVAKGSDEPPKAIVLRYVPEGASGRAGRGEDRPLLALAGKAITFDSGGLSLKTAAGMEEMKFDMCGGAAVIGAMRAIAALRPGVEVVGVVMATENMPGGHAQRPGDVVRAMNGKTIEIMNTDAEGRLILADGVAYACSLGATHVVDVATLTGAVVTALGNQAFGLIGNNEQLAAAVRAAAAEAGERVWALPAWEEYKEQYKSHVADLKNVGGTAAGAITGGLIIGEFVEPGVAWVHLDIAGTAWHDKDLPTRPRGATGVAVRTLAMLAAGWKDAS